MALTEHHDVFFGSTRDGWTFAVLNRPLAGAAQILVGAGFTPRSHRGHTLYALPPEKAPDAPEATGIALYGLMAQTYNIATLAWTAVPQHPAPSQPDVLLRFSHGTVTATVTAADSAAVLVQYGFRPAGRTGHYALPSLLSERERLSAVVPAEAHLLTTHHTVRIDLGIATIREVPVKHLTTGPVPAASPVPRPARTHH
jgi:hypothetical protein